MIFITGDIHGAIDIHKFSTVNFPIQKTLTRSDHVIICGDFGLVWDNSKEEKYWLNWLDSKPWTTLWIDGNHENFDLLSEYPIEEWNGGRVQKITENIIHLCRGSVFDIDGVRFFAFGGAESHDKEYRTLGVSIWEAEMPTEEEMEYGRQCLDAVGRKVDVVLTHTLPQYIQSKLFPGYGYENNKLTAYFDEINDSLEFKLWFSGHYHLSMPFDDKHFLIYNDIVKLTDTGFERAAFDTKDRRR